MTLALANIATVTFMIDMWGGTHAIGVLTLNMLHCFKKIYYHQTSNMVGLFEQRLSNAEA